ncbi:MAG: PKD domain-containing protein, partial [Thermoplasmata archaeon]|nr:PKD domain-containing protein [Thermoplasmata archaeon]
ALGLSFRIVAAGSGTIRLDGVPESNGSAAPYLAAGLYVAQFLPGPDQFFKSWSGSGGITLLNATPLGWPLGTELVNLTGAAAVLTAHAARGTPPVTFLLSTPPGTTPTFRVNGTTVAHNGTIDVGAGSIPVSIQGSLPPGMGVRSWTAVGGVQVEGANGTQATIFVNGSGTVMPLLGPVLSVLASATPANASSVGSSEWAPLTVDFAAIASNGTGPYLYQWTYGDGQTGVGASGTHRFPLPGVYGWQVGVTDHGGNLTSASGTLVVTGAPWAVALNLTPSVGEAPFNVSVSLNTTGPSGNSTFQWAVPLLGLTTPGPSGRFQVTGPGVYQVVAQAHNFQGFLSQALAVVTAEPNVFLIVSATPGTGTVPLIVHFDAAAINATGTTVYNWSFGDGAYASAPIVQHQYERNGTFEANVSVVDGLGGAAEKSVVVRVVPPPPPLRVQMQLDPANLVLGNTTRIGTNTTGGVPSYVVVYPTKDLPPGCIPLPRPPNASFFCTPVAAGNFLVQVSVMDSDGHEANASGWLNVTGPPAAKMPVRSTTTNPPLYTPAELYGAIAAALAVAAVLGVLLRRRTPPPKEPEDLPSDLELADGSVLPSGPDSWGMSGPDDTSEFDPGPPPR